MAETVTEVEQRALAGSVFDVTGDDACLGPDCGGDRLKSEVGVACQDSPAVCLAPGKKGWIVNQPIFHDFCVAGPQLAGIERSVPDRAGIEPARAGEVEAKA